MLQSVLIPKNLFTKYQADEWIKLHNFHPYKCHITQNYYRYRISMPSKQKKYYSLILPNNIIFIMYE